MTSSKYNHDDDELFHYRFNFERASKQISKHENATFLCPLCDTPHRSNVARSTHLLHTHEASLSAVKKYMAEPGDGGGDIYLICPGHTFSDQTRIYRPCDLHTMRCAVA